MMLGPKCAAADDADDAVITTQHRLALGSHQNYIYLEYMLRNYVRFVCIL